MKISRIIIIAFTVFVVGSLLVLYVDSKNHKNESRNDTVLRSSPLQDFSVLVAEDSSDIHLNQAATNTIAVEFLKDKVVKKQMYKLTNDTLYVYGGLRTFVDCKKVKSIIVHKTFWLGINSFQLDSLNLDVTGGQVLFTANEKTKMSIGLMHMNVRDTARIEMYNDVIIDDIYVNATDESYLGLTGKLKRANIIINNKAKLNLRGGPLSLKLERDESTIVNLYQ